MGPVQGSPCPHCPPRGHTGNGCVLPAPREGWPRGGKRLTPDALTKEEGQPPGKASHNPRGGQSPAGHARQRDSTRPARPHTRARSTRASDPDCPPQEWAARGGRAPDFRRHSQWREAAFPGTPSRNPPCAQRRLARAHAVGPVLGFPRPHHPRPATRGNGVRLPAPRDGRPGEKKRLTPGAPHNGGRAPPRDGLRRPPQHAAPCRACTPKGQYRTPTPARAPPRHNGSGPRLPPVPGTGSAARGGQALFATARDIPGGTRRGRPGAAAWSPHGHQRQPGHTGNDAWPPPGRGKAPDARRPSQR